MPTNSGSPGYKNCLMLILLTSLNLISHRRIQLSSPPETKTVLYRNSSVTLKQVTAASCAFGLETIYCPHINSPISPLLPPVIISDSISLPKTLEMYAKHLRQVYYNCVYYLMMNVF